MPNYVIVYKRAGGLCLGGTLVFRESITAESDDEAREKTRVFIKKQPLSGVCHDTPCRLDHVEKIDKKGRIVGDVYIPDLTLK